MSTQDKPTYPPEVTAYEFGRIKLDLNNKTFHILHQFDGNGRHRLVSRSHKLSSAWAGYCFIAQLDIPNVGMFRGTSEYYGDNLPRVFQLIGSITEAVK